MSFASIRIITDDLEGLVAFYEKVTGLQAERPAPVFAQLTGPNANLAIASTATIEMLDGALTPATSEDVVLEPTTMPWGNRSALVRDPDGNVVNLFTKPAT
jgi:catechol 2,3-dioxygenase-like lactoylglutathione lyase family enzyme